ncbi:hypothetical protein EV643_11325 [Kribbella sp. VKM Ac-2527]|uniref:Uncharacterized protein n=1 Tax=Kribbella caucasensis TaxID=2512215 RepID=A0A4R6KC07_9ACTN|nr:hypothetical protein [Kribbella sp. VKM Ac-2527]TDO45252.1 hypothetical protein EV643_11325 [Kribbella sp. VKM Ac-2527]
MSVTDISSVSCPLSRSERDALFDALRYYRNQLQDAWSDETIHESFRSASGEQAPASRGQCGVSSAWLVERLRADDRSLKLSYCYGDVLSTVDDTPVLPRHCWVEIGDEDDPGRLVVDLTGDQAESLRDYPVLCLPHDELRRDLRTEYRVTYVRLDPEGLRNDLVQPRLGILKRRLRAGI